MSSIWSDNIRFRNQYIATIRNPNLALPRSFVSKSLGEITIHAHPSLKVITTSRNGLDVFLIGFIIDPFSPVTSDDAILNDIAVHCDTKDKLFRRIQGLSGRFVIIYKDKDSIIALGDAGGQRQIYYGQVDGRPVLTSSPKLFVEAVGGEPIISEIKREFMKLPELEREEYAWYSDEAIDDRLCKVLPNHYLDIKKMRVRRIPISVADLVSFSDLVDYTACILKGGIEGILNRFEVVQPLTGGWDSRTLLAASRNFKEFIQFYVFDLGTQADVVIPSLLSDRLKLNFKVIKLEKPTNAFVDLFAAEYILPRKSKVQDNFYLYQEYGNRNVVRVSGVGSAITKSFYGFTNGTVSQAMLRRFTFYPAYNRFVTNGVERWFQSAEEYCNEYGLRILDLFHWEEKEGNWGALCASEQDIAIEEFWPHANRNFLVSALRLDPRLRCSPRCFLYERLIKAMWPEVLSEPINPVGMGKKIRKILKRNARLRYYNVILMDIIDSLKNNS